MSQPNVLLIFTDQQRADTIQAAGNPIIKTPHLDRLVAEGVLFKSAYTPSPVCVSARCSLIYGLYPHNTGCFDNGYPMPDDRPSLMELLSRAGYRTHGIGKMHFTPDSHALRGFQTREHQEEMRARVEDDDYLKFLHANGFDHVYDPFGQRGEMYYIPQPAQMPARLHGTNWVGDRAVEFIRNADRSRPFFLWASFIHPHPPFSPPTPWNKLYRAALMPLPKRPDGFETLHTYMNRYQNRYKYRDNGIDNNLLRVMKAYYYACISFIDFQIGRILEALEETDRLENTMIIFTSDHGEFLGDYNCFGKRSMLDAAARVPMIVRYPERFARGYICETPTSLVDIMPTILAAAGIDPKDHNLDGVDLAEAVGYDDRTIYSQYQRGPLGVYMILNRRWKYFYSAPDRREFLFDRIHDPEETRNRAGLSLCRREQEEMRGELIGFYKEQGYTEPIEGDRWKLFPQPSIPVNPDAGLLIQDPGWSLRYQRIPGYTD
ncbi:sulfatase-like hydrolase/transferase [Candidatus Poribacteria bacterium]|nr:sulfatase-like hydrolase/transferase [Candidatus Poribacteria bacterium]